MLTKSGIDPRKLGLTLANIQMHEKGTRNSTDNFLPKINRLLGMINVSRMKSEMGCFTNKMCHFLMRFISWRTMGDSCDHKTLKRMKIQL